MVDEPSKSQTFVFKKVAHPGAPGQDQLGDILDNLGLVLGRQSTKPFRKTL